MKGHIQKRGKKSWRLKFDLPPDVTTRMRRTRYLTVQGTKKDAETKLAEVLTAVNQKTFVNASRTTFGEFANQWLETSAAANVSPKTLERYGDLLRKQLLPTFEFIRIQDISGQDIELLYVQLGKTGRHDGKGGLSPRTVRHVHVLLGQIMRSAVRKSLISVNPMSMVENAPKFEEKEIEVLDEQQLNTLLRSLKGTMLYMPSLLAASTGMRRGEVLALRWRDIDFGTLKLTVAQSIEETRAGLRFKEPKTKSGRRQIALPESVVRALAEHKRDQAERRIALGLGRDENGLVFTTFDGRPRVPRNFTREFTKAVAATELPQITFHGLRHTHITHLLKAGVPVKVVSERAGHANISITLQTYAHVMPGMQEDAAALIEQSLKAAFED
ncbi:MAG: tyrosine-type recombinase/integrase [Alphaproteobacteria bacterium]|nr:tyrosine-type recombinase/integrase [Alphaproteobacteria bacterium]MCZ6591640.1 tyrosine-type recombinase/integrase [Alphaproteobacteria bacterium]